MNMADLEPDFQCCDTSPNASNVQMLNGHIEIPWAKHPS